MSTRDTAPDRHCGNPKAVTRMRGKRGALLTSRVSWLWLWPGLALVLGAAPLLGTVYWFAPPDWAGSTGTLLNHAEASPVLFSERELIRAMQDNPADPAEAEVTVNLLPGLYPTGPLRFRRLYTAQETELLQRLRLRRLTLRRAPGYGKEVVFRLKPDAPSCATGETWILANGSGGTIARWVVEDITFDLNWPHLASRIQPANLKRYKNGALMLDAYTGALRRVKVRNYGANNIVPVPNYAASGAEAFAIVVHATDFRQAPDPGSGAPTAWVVEDCEVSGFTGVHEGYSTAIIVTVGYPKFEPDWGQTLEGIGTLGDEVPPELRARYGGLLYWSQVQEQPGGAPGQKDWRVVTVRRCQIRGVPYGLGLAAAGGVTYSDNVVLGALLGFNTDSGPIRNVDFANNVFLDVSWGGNLGGWGWWSSGFVNYLVRSNLVRLSGPPLQQNYCNYCFNTENEITSRARPVLGGFFTNVCAGLVVGGSSDIDFSYNRLTTRGCAEFHQPNPLDTARAVFRPVYRPATGPEVLWCSGPAMPVNQQVAPQMDALALSGIAFIFADYTALVAGSGTTNELPALSTPPPGFPAGAAMGFAGRVQMLTNSQGSLVGVQEVALGRPQPVGDGSFEVRAQWLFHPTYFSEFNTTQVRFPGSIQFEIRGADGGAASFQGPTVGPDSARIAFNPPGAGWYRIVAFVRDPSRSSPGFDPEADFWAETELRHGEVVWFFPSADVATARLGIPATVTVERSGTGPLTVRLRLEDQTGISLHSEPPVSYSAERFGPLAELGADFLITTSEGAVLPQNPDGTFSLSFEPTRTSASLRVLPVSDQVPEPLVLYLSLEAGAETYTVAPSRRGVNTHPYLPKSAAVVIYGGPRFELIPLSDWDPFSVREASATFASALDDHAPPRVAGYSLLDNPLTAWLGVWTDPEAQPFMKRLPTRFPPSAELRGLSFNSLAVGTDGANAIAAEILRPVVHVLPGLSVGASAEAHGINPHSPNRPPGLAANTTYIAGSARSAGGVWRPVLWSANGSGWLVEDLGAFGGGAPALSGVAQAVNDSGRVIGVGQMPEDPAGVADSQRAFRVAAGRGLRGAAAPDGWLGLGRPKTAEGVTLVPAVNAGRAIDLMGDAVGGSDLVIKNLFGLGILRQYHAVFWRQDRQEPVDLGVLSYADQSEALGVSAYLARSTDGTLRRLANGSCYPEYIEAVGWSHAKRGSSQRRAFYALHMPHVRFWKLMVDLNDPHVVAGLEDWTLEEARAINEQGYIAGVGSYRGARRGFLLAPIRGGTTAPTGPRGRSRPYFIDPLSETRFDFVATVASIKLGEAPTPGLAVDLRCAGAAVGGWDELGPARFTNTFRLLTRPEVQVLVSRNPPGGEVFPVAVGRVIGELTATEASWAASSTGFALLVSEKLRESSPASYTETVLGQSGPLTSVSRAILAARVLAADGWHYGWVALTNSAGAHLAISSYSFAVEPGRAIVAGELVRPHLRLERVGGNIRLSWSGLDPSFVLESADGMPAGGWSAAPGVIMAGERREVLLPSVTGTRYFRLRK